MKTAVSIPDQIYERAERLAEKMQLSRSRLFTNALEEYVQRHDSDEVVATMNDVVASIEGEPDPFVQRAAITTLRRNPW